MFAQGREPRADERAADAAAVVFWFVIYGLSNSIHFLRWY